MRGFSPFQFCAKARAIIILLSCGCVCWRPFMSSWGCTCPASSYRLSEVLKSEIRNCIWCCAGWFIDHKTTSCGYLARAYRFHYFVKCWKAFHFWCLFSLKVGTWRRVDNQIWSFYRSWLEMSFLRFWSRDFLEFPAFSHLATVNLKHWHDVVVTCSTKKKKLKKTIIWILLSVSTKIWTTY